MPKITYVAVDGTAEDVDVPIGSSVMRGAVAAGIDGIVAECGGNAMCATCHVYVPTDYLDALPTMTVVEDEMLECALAERRGNSRLSCQLHVTEDLHGLRVELPEEQQ